MKQKEMEIEAKQREREREGQTRKKKSRVRTHDDSTPMNLANSSKCTFFFFLMKTRVTVRVKKNLTNCSGP